MFIRVSGGRKKSEKFVATKGTITITSNVTGASIKVLNGADVVAEGVTDGTPFTTKVLPAGTYTVVVSKEGFEDVTKNVVVNGDVSESIELTAGVLNVASIKAVNALGEKTDLDGATVSRASSFELTFDRAFDEATVTNSTIKLVKGNETMAISLPTIDNGVIAFKSLSVLDPDAEYKVVVDGIKSEKGTAVITNQTIATFKTTNTVVTKKITANNTKIYDTTTNDGVSLNVTNDWAYGENGSSINVRFDTPVDKSTINSQSVQLVDVTAGKNIAVEANQTTNYSEELEIKVVGTKDYLTPKHQYKLVLNGLKAANGADIDAFALTFAYQAGKPAEVSTNIMENGDMKKVSNTKEGLVNPLTDSKMLDDGVTFKAAAAITVDFGAADVRLDDSTVTTDYLYIREKDTHKKVAQKISYNKELNRVTLTPTERLKDDTSYEVFESPYIKNIYGVTLGTKDSDYKTAEFKTLDVTAPTVVGQPESTLEDKSISKLPVDKVTKIKLKMSEKIGAVSDTTDAKNFAAGTGNGNVLVTRADDETIAAANGVIKVERTTIGKDDYVQLTIDPTKETDIKNNIKGKTFRVTLAGTNPTRKNTPEKVITDQAPAVVNAMANDYSFTFTFEGEDKTAPKITDVKVQDGKDYTSLQGMTNVDLSKSIRVYFDCKDVNADSLVGGIVIHDKDNKPIYAATPSAISITGETSYVDLTYNNVPEGSVSLKAQDVQDNAGNKSSLQTYDFVAGFGPVVTSVLFDKPLGSTSEDSYVKVVLPNNIDTTTLNGNIKLMNGDKEVKTTIDTSEYSNKSFIKVVPSEKLSGNTKYTLIISKNVKDTDGNCLQQNPNVAPADYKVDITTDDDAKPAIKGDVTYKDGKLTVPFDTKLGIVKSVTVKNSQNNTTVEAKASVKDDVNAEITFTDEAQTGNDVLSKNIQYNVELEVVGANGQSSTVTTSFVPADNYKPDLRPAVELKAYIDGVEVAAGAKPNVNDDASFTLSFDKAVAVSAIKGLAITNVGGKDYTPDVAYTEGLDKDGKMTNTVKDIVYATEFTVDIPGLYKDPNEFRFTLAKDTEICLGQTEDSKANKAKSKDDIKFVVLSLSGDDSAEYNAVADDTKALNVSYDGKAATINLPAAGTNGSTISWESDTPSIIASAQSGASVTVTRDDSDDTDDVVVLTATITDKSNKYTKTKTFSITVKEGKKPTVEATLEKVDDTHVKLIFSEEVDKELAETASNYALSGNSGFSGKSTKATLSADGKSVELEISDMKDLVKDSTVIVTVSNVTDLAGNAVDDSNKVATYTVLGE